jgi:hypothetical protein
MAQGNDAITSEGEEYPRIYDRMHLSNVPDYTSGSLLYHVYLPSQSSAVEI